MAQYKAVIFDFGGVLTEPPGNGMRAYCEGAGISWDAFRQLFAPPDGAWARFETNALSQDEFIRAFEAEAAAAGLKVDGAAFLNDFFSGMALRQDMVAVARTLHERYKLGCITNNVQAVGRARNPLFDDLFEVVVESSKVGMRKPDPRIYRHCCELLGVPPPQAIFLDDFGVNLKAARELGMGTVKVDESQSAIDELERLLGITLPRDGSGQSAAG
ncbi:MAG TPA: HAD family phosphatase [Dehalococcoidia bacterium]|nr:HAD family phosphatase [Dehalococcoidia bacterium]